MHPFSYVSAEDALFGAVGIELDHEAGTLAVGGDGVPRTEIRRAAGTPLESHVPIGTRDPERLAMSVDGVAVDLRPAKGFLTRKSYRVDVARKGPATAATAGYGHRLVPVSLGTSRLLRDGTLLGVLTSTGDGRVTAEWEKGAAPVPYDASVGYALAAAFGTGAEPMWKLAWDAVLGTFF
ncbi:hypothetical protein ADL21_16080 [Streptomyces albus subsp. albus]|nr:hypothetical protein ADL21_16080 [Streptomyces albus subsp. albus]